MIDSLDRFFGVLRSVTGNIYCFRGNSDMEFDLLKAFFREMDYKVEGLGKRRKI